MSASVHLHCDHADDEGLCGTVFFATGREMAALNLGYPPAPPISKARYLAQQQGWSSSLISSAQYPAGDSMDAVDTCPAHSRPRPRLNLAALYEDEDG